MAVLATSPKVSTFTFFKPKQLQKRRFSRHHFTKRPIAHCARKIDLSKHFKKPSCENVYSAVTVQPSIPPKAINMTTGMEFGKHVLRMLAYGRSCHREIRAQESDTLHGRSKRGSLSNLRSEQPNTRIISRLLQNHSLLNFVMTKLLRGLNRVPTSHVLSLHCLSLYHLSCRPLLEPLSH